RCARILGSDGDAPALLGFWLAEDWLPPFRDAPVLIRIERRTRAGHPTKPLDRPAHVRSKSTVKPVSDRPLTCDAWSGLPTRFLPRARPYCSGALWPRAGSTTRRLSSSHGASSVQD